MDLVSGTGSIREGMDEQDEEDSLGGAATERLWKNRCHSAGLYAMARPPSTKALSTNSPWRYADFNYKNTNT